MDDFQQTYNTPLEDTRPMSVKDWFLTLLVTAIPLIGLIMLFVWGFGGGNNVNKSNYAKAALLLMAIVLVLYALFFILIFGMFS